MIDRIIFFVESTFDERDYKRFGVELLQSEGFKVEIWDFTPFLRAEYYERTSEHAIKNFAGYRSYRTAREAEKDISDLNESTSVMCIVSYNFDSWPLYRALSKTGSEYSSLFVGALPA